MTDLVQKLVGALEEAEEWVQEYVTQMRLYVISDDAAKSLANIRAALSEAKAGGWVAVEQAPLPRDDGSYLVANAARGVVAPYVRGVIHNNTGTNWDWNYGDSVSHWQPLPAPPAQRGEG